MWTPDAGDLSGADAIIEYMSTVAEAFPGATYEFIAKHEAGNTAIDEGHLVGTSTGPLKLPSGDTLPATGKQLRLRGCDVATVRNGRITRHHLYYDQVAFAEQLGLTQLSERRSRVSPLTARTHPLARTPFGRSCDTPRGGRWGGYAVR